MGVEKHWAANNPEIFSNYIPPLSPVLDLLPQLEEEDISFKYFVIVCVVSVVGTKWTRGRYYQ